MYILYASLKPIHKYFIYNYIGGLIIYFLKGK
jgi:hypothetical protein